MTQKPQKTTLSGHWPGGARWEFFLSDELPDINLCTTVACVAIRDLAKKEIVLTCESSGRGTKSDESWEMPGGHIDPIDPKRPNGPKETPEQALAREALEEAGFVIASAHPFGYRRVVNPKSSKYPPLSYTPFYWATTKRPLRKPTDAKRAGTFPIEAVRDLVRKDEMQADELKIIEYGLAAALRRR